MNDYYSIKLKKSRLRYFLSTKISVYECWYFNIKYPIPVFESFKPNKVVNLAAQAGVRYSLENPHAYIKSNIEGFINILECCKNYNVDGLIYASSSSVYGTNNKIPFSVFDKVNNPISMYAVTKNTNELMPILIIIFTN